MCSATIVSILQCNNINLETNGAYFEPIAKEKYSCLLYTRILATVRTCYITYTTICTSSLPILSISVVLESNFHFRVYDFFPLKDS